MKDTIRLIVLILIFIGWTWWLWGVSFREDNPLYILLWLLGIAALSCGGGGGPPGIEDGYD